MTQDIIVYTLITAAVINVIYGLAKTLNARNEPKCGTCPSCHSKTAVKRNIPKHLGI